MTDIQIDGVKYILNALASGTWIFTDHKGLEHLQSLNGKDQVPMSTKDFNFLGFIQVLSVIIQEELIEVKVKVHAIQKVK